MMASGEPTAMVRSQKLPFKKSVKMAERGEISLPPHQFVHKTGHQKENTFDLSTKPKRPIIDSGNKGSKSFKVGSRGTLVKRDTTSRLTNKSSDEIRSHPIHCTKSLVFTTGNFFYKKV